MTEASPPPLTPDQRVLLETLQVVAKLVIQNRVTMLALAADTPTGAVLGWHMVPGLGDPLRMRGMLCALDDKVRSEQNQGPTPTLFGPDGGQVQ